MKIIGYIIALIGIVIGGLSFKFKIPNVPTQYVLIGGIALIIIGVVFTLGKKEKQVAKEVPIYRGKEIVGYRRH